MRDIRSHLANLYGVQISQDLISKVTDAVNDTVIDVVTVWGEPAADPVWPVVYIDALWVKIRGRLGLQPPGPPRGRD